MPRHIGQMLPAILVAHFCPGIHGLWVCDSSIQDLLIDNEWIVVDERRKSLNELIEKHSQAPEIDSGAMAATLNDLWCQVLRRPTERPRPAPILLARLM